MHHQERSSPGLVFVYFEVITRGDAKRRPRVFNMKRLLILFFLIIAAFIGRALAQQYVILAWNPVCPSQNAIAAYVLWYIPLTNSAVTNGTMVDSCSGSNVNTTLYPSNTFNTNNIVIVTNGLTQGSISNLLGNTTYLFGVTAIDSSNHQSYLSSEVIYKTPPTWTPTNAPPRLILSNLYYTNLLPVPVVVTVTNKINHKVYTYTNYGPVSIIGFKITSDDWITNHWTLLSRTNLLFPVVTNAQGSNSMVSVIVSNTSPMGFYRLRIP